MRIILALYFLLGMSGIYPLAAQSGNIVTITEADNGKRLIDLLDEIEHTNNIDFITDRREELEAYTVTGVTESLYLGEFLEFYLKPLGLVAVKPEDNIYLFISKDIQKSFGNRKSNFLILNSGKNTKSATIKGIVADAADQPIPGAQIVIPELGVGAISAVDGSFSLNVKKGIYKIRTTFIGFDSTAYIVAFSPLGKKKAVDMMMLPQSIHLEGITITAKASDNNVQSQITGVNSMNIETIKELPSFMGETDVIRSLTTFPGVSTAGELSSGFNVRGGDVGQNLILQDESIIFNPTHLFGFFSAFNPDIVNGADLYKGGGPANYGGRISSVLNISLRNGDAGKYNINGGVGLVSSRLTVEGPIQKSKSSFIIGGRLSYVNWMINALNNVKLQNSEASFRDLTGKLFFTLNDKNIVSVSGYTSYDNFRLNSDSTFSWTTQNFNVKWDHIFGDRLSSKLNFSNSNYKSTVDNQDEINGFIYYNSINNLRLNYDLVYAIDEKLKTSFGFDINQREIEPGRLESTDLGMNIVPVDLNDQHSAETSVYLQNDYDITSSLAISAGLRFSNFWRYGKDRLFDYDYTQLDGRYPTIIDTLTYAPGEIISYYGGLEPRVSLRYSVSEDFSVKASYYRTYQYLHLISNTVSVTPQDYWLSSSPHLKPQKADQWSVGLFKNLNKDKFELSAEGFYKDIYDAIDYIEGADITLNESMEAGLIQGKGMAYGLEFMAKKNYGKLYGWLSYTYSRSLRRFEATEEYQTINDGKLYPSVYDQPHNLSLVMSVMLNPYVIFSTNFSYSTGRPITIPISKLSYEHYLSVLTYSNRNEYRIPDYHRLDISLTIKDRPKQNKVMYGEWVFGIYNLYGRKNAYSVFFNSKGSAFKMSILGTVFPSITYNFKI